MAGGECGGFSFLQRHSLPEALQPVSWLEGRWRSEKAAGSFPSIAPFEYGEEIHFYSVGQPILCYQAFTWHPEKKTPMHLESGFLRIKPGSNQVAFMVAHNFGLTSLEEGEVDTGNNNLVLDSVSVSRMSFAKDPAVQKIKRTFTLKEAGKLEQVLCMETGDQPMTEHLKACYSRLE